MEHFVPIFRFPDGLRFPSDLSDKIHYDPVTRRLIFRGFMSKADFDRLSRLSDDWSYRRALEDLFRLCIPEDRPRHGLARLLSVFGASR